MKLSAYIKDCQDILDRYGDIEYLFTSIDDEGNGYNQVTYSPEIRLLMNPGDDTRPDSLICPRHQDENVEDWLDNNCLDIEDVPLLERVVLL